MSDTTCPMCGRVVGEGERLYVEYSTKRQWWVFHHETEVTVTYENGQRIVSGHPFCGIALPDMRDVTLGADRLQVARDAREFA